MTSDDDVTGKVKVMLDGKKLDTAKLKDGRVVLKMKANLKLGKHKIVAKYLVLTTSRAARTT